MPDKGSPIYLSAVEVVYLNPAVVVNQLVGIKKHDKQRNPTAFQRAALPSMTECVEKCGSSYRQSSKMNSIMMFKIAHSRQPQIDATRFVWNLGYKSILRLENV
jgi:hypothetical protein